MVAGVNAFLARSASDTTYGVIKEVVRAVAADDEHASLSRGSHSAMRWVEFMDVGETLYMIGRSPR